MTLECSHGERACTHCHVEAKRKVADLEREVSTLKRDNDAIGKRAWNHAITCVIAELRRMKYEDAQRLADRIISLRERGSEPSEGHTDE